MAKTNTVLIKLVSSADTGYFYVAKKNPRAKTEKLELKKYDPVARKHVVFKERRSSSADVPSGFIPRQPGLEPGIHFFAGGGKIGGWPGQARP